MTPQVDETFQRLLLPLDVHSDGAVAAPGLHEHAREPSRVELAGLAVARHGDPARGLAAELDGADLDPTLRPMDPSNRVSSSHPTPLQACATSLC